VEKNVPQVSIVTPSFNSKQYVLDAINSVKKQSFHDWEMIIVDDCSNDGSQSFIREIIADDSRISLICLTQNKGPAFSRNCAISQAKGEYIAFLDSDDLWLESFLSSMVSFMQKNNFDFAFSSYKRMNEDFTISYSDFIVPEKVCYKDILSNCPISSLTAIYNKKRIGKVYLKDFEREDYTLWLQILRKIPYGYGIKEPLAIYRIRSDSRSRNKLLMAKYQWRIYRECEGLSFLKSLFFFLRYILSGIKKYKGI